MSLVSVILPTFDRLAVLPRAIDSVLGQTYTALELIVVDDGSSDGTAEWFASRYPDHRLIRQANAGVSAARNRGIAAACGDWIALIDSDDRWLPHKLETQMRAIATHPGHRLCHADEIWIRNGRRVNPMKKHEKRGGQIFAHCLPLCAISPSAALIERELLNEVGGFDESLPACEDYDLWLRLCAREPALYVDEFLLEKYGGHEDQLSRRYPAMDRYRLQALASLLHGTPLTDAQRSLALTEFHRKYAIYTAGALRRGRQAHVEALNRQYADLLATATG